MDGEQGGVRPSSLESGVLAARWAPADPDCAHAPPFLVYEYNDTFIILRQSGCTHFEKPFLYLILGSAEALLVDTGAPGADVSAAVDDVLRRHAQREHREMLRLVVVHSHGHGDHTAGDGQLKRRSATTVVDATPQAVAAFFRIADWPRGAAEHDLGGRIVDIVPIPGHQPASIAIYDRRTGILLTGDTLYPGRLYVNDAPAFADSITRLVEFTAARDVAHMLGAHIENTIVEVVANPSEMQPTDARQRNAPGVCTDLRLNRNQRRCPLQVFSNRVRRFGTIDPATNPRPSGSATLPRR